MIYEQLFRILGWIPATMAHQLAARFVGPLAGLEPLRRALARRLKPTDPALLVTAFGLEFPSPLGVAAGMDKGATWFKALDALGFGFVEVGTFTARAQKRNPGLINHRLPADRGLWNKAGFPNPGALTGARRIRRRPAHMVLGVNVGKLRETPLESAAADYAETVRLLAASADYVVINVSSPNTDGLRALQSIEWLEEIVDAVEAALAALGRPLPVLVKLSPDLSGEELDQVAAFALRRGLAGIIAVNTTTSRDGLRSDLSALPEGGGVSGRPLKAAAMATLRRLYARVGDNLVLVSAGGIEDSEDVLARVRAGATLVQAHTGFIYGGPGWPKQVNDDLVEHLRTAGVSNIQALVGTEIQPVSGAGPFAVAV